MAGPRSRVPFPGRHSPSSSTAQTPWTASSRSPTRSHDHAVIVTQLVTQRTERATCQDRKWPVTWVGVAGFEPAASSSRSQVRTLSPCGGGHLTLAQPSTNVHSCTLVSARIVTPTSRKTLHRGQRQMLGAWSHERDQCHSGRSCTTRHRWGSDLERTRAGTESSAHPATTPG